MGLGAGFLKNISYSVGANLISLVGSVFMVMVVPKALSLEDYGIWQLFLFYFSYLGIFHFGWLDGIYLRYAGKTFEELPRKKLAGQFYAILLSQIIIMALAYGAIQWIENSEKSYALRCAAVLLPIVNLSTLCSFILQITNRIQEYAKVMVYQRVIFIVGVLVLILCMGHHSYEDMYMAQVVSLVIAGIVYGYVCRSFLMPRLESIIEIAREAAENLTVGIRLLLANVASIAMVGIVRYGISIGWDLSVFGKVALTLNISNFLMSFTAALGIVAFPIIKRMSVERRGEVYMKLRCFMTFILFGAMLFCYPLRSILSWWLPQYADSLLYMVVLFPICIFESKNTILITPYLNSMRKEGTLLKINAISLCMSAVLVYINVEVLHSLNGTILTLIAVYVFRTVVAELVMARILGLSLLAGIGAELVLATIFIVSGWCWDGTIHLLIYGMAYAMFLMRHASEVKGAIKFLKNR